MHTHAHDLRRRRKSSTCVNNRQRRLAAAIAANTGHRGAGDDIFPYTRHSGTRASTPLPEKKPGANIKPPPLRANRFNTIEIRIIINVFILNTPQTTTEARRQTIISHRPPIK